MSNETERMLFQVIKESQSKYVYFLLAATAAMIAFALNQTQTTKLIWKQFPVGMAVLLWGISFYFGCRHLRYVNSALYANYHLVRIQNGKDPEVGNHPLVIKAASDGIISGIEINSDAANSYANYQFRFLISGALSYICWHVLRMTA